MDLKRERMYITLLVLPNDDPAPELVLRARLIVTLAEAIFTIWLGSLARDREENRSLAYLCPWDEGDLDYTGWCSHNPLKLDVRLPRRQELIVGVEAALGESDDVALKVDGALKLSDDAVRDIDAVLEPSVGSLNSIRSTAVPEEDGKEEGEDGSL
jgi:hypothetical protein